MSSPTRRRTLGALGTGAAAALAGCGLPVLGSDGGPPAHLNWFGPDVVMASRWLTLQRDVDDPFDGGVGTGGYVAIVPDRLSSEAVGEDHAAQVRERIGRTDLVPGEFAVPTDSVAVDVDNLSTIRCFEGDFDVDALRDALPGDPARTDDLGDGSLVVVPDTREETAPVEYVGVGLTPDYVAITAAPDEPHAAEFARSCVETRTGDRDRYLDASDLFARAADHLPASAFNYTGEVVPGTPRLSAYHAEGPDVRLTLIDTVESGENVTAESLRENWESQENFEDLSVSVDGELVIARATYATFPDWE